MFTSGLHGFDSDNELEIVYKCIVYQQDNRFATGILTACIPGYTLCRLMSPDLPLTIAPARLARKGESIQGQYAIPDLQRLVDLLHDQSGHVIFELVFNRDEDRNQVVITGKVEAQVSLICQRCMGMLQYTVDSPVYLGVVSDAEGASQLPDGCEPLFVEGDSASLLAIIEDEILLALPITAMHEEDECDATEFLAKLQQKSRNNPFSILKKTEDQ